MSMTHLSHSQASEYARCSKAYQLRRLQGYPAKPATWLFGGSLVHQAIEIVNLAVARGEAFDFQKVWDNAWDMTVADQEQRNPGIKPEDYRQPFRGGRDLDWWRENGQDHVHAWIDWLGKTDWKIATHEGVPMVEFDVATQFGYADEMFDVKGFIDVVMRQPSGALILLDVKTGKAPNNFQQLGLYACALERMGLPRPEMGGFFLTKEGRLGPVDSLNGYKGTYFDDLFTRVRNGVAGGIFQPILDDNICRMCDVREGCYAIGGREAHLYDPDSPKFESNL
jgi:hypothetical protein